jgi:hypothetical protein
LATGSSFVDLSALSDASLVVPAIAQTLSLREAPGRSLVETLGDYLSAKEMVLILDNFEQVMDAAAEVSSLVVSSSLKVVVTSREALRIEGEREFALHPLALPSPESDIGEIVASPPVELFVARARAVRPIETTVRRPWWQVRIRAQYQQFVRLQHLHHEMHSGFRRAVGDVVAELQVLVLGQNRVRARHVGGKQQPIDPSICVPPGALPAQLNEPRPHVLAPTAEGDGVVDKD